ncbi:MAG: YggS family pyridoxal phosphate-dependent enzyme [Candidatus Heimdallarchaeota archaeon]|nr:MAG: YggS family pyridoxal phosphate-dependent enzyme [Candidatus Heimdallarchaeota archaeon]
MVNVENQVVKNYQRILSLLARYTHSGEQPQLVIVTKNQSVELISKLLSRLERPIIGENRVQEALQKFKKCGALSADWHFIGHLQRNKVKKVIGKFSLIHSLDRFSLAKEIQKRGANENIITNCLLQIDICQDGSKYGIHPSEEAIKDFFMKIATFSHLKIRGLMTIAPFVAPEETRFYFKRMRTFFENMKNFQALPSNIEMKILSMGMSNDYIIALEEGATMIRLGSAIFGEPTYI